MFIDRYFVSRRESVFGFYAVQVVKRLSSSLLAMENINSLILKFVCVRLSSWRVKAEGPTCSKKGPFVIKIRGA